jgi:O-antigen/teichoic acid export membrane protein
MLAVVECVGTLVGQLVMVIACRRTYPELRPRYALPPKRVVADLAGYGGALVLFHTFGHVAAYTPVLIIGKMLSPVAVTIYAIAQSLAEAVRYVLVAVSPVFTPLASRYGSTRNERGLRLILEQGTRLVLVLVLPIVAVLGLRGATFIGLWMGPDYAEPSGAVLRVLCIWTTLAAANSCASNVLFGLGRQRVCVVWTGVQTAATVCLCLVAGVHSPVAVAWAVALPACAVHLFFWPQSACRAVGVPVWAHLQANWGKPALAVLPFGVACFVADRHWMPTSVWGFLLQVAALLPLYALTCAIVLWQDTKQLWTIIRPSGGKPIAAPVVS